MTKELEQAAKDIQECMLQFMPHIFGHKNLLKKFWDAFYVLTKENDLAVAYHEAQGWVSVDVIGNFAEWVRCNYIKVAQGYMHRMASIGSSATQYYQMGDLVKMFLEINSLPSPPKTDKQ